MMFLISQGQGFPDLQIILTVCQRDQRIYMRQFYMLETSNQPVQNRKNMVDRNKKNMSATSATQQYPSQAATVPESYFGTPRNYIQIPKYPKSRYRSSSSNMKKSKKLYGVGQFSRAKLLKGIVDKITEVQVVNKMKSDQQTLEQKFQRVQNMISQYVKRDNSSSRMKIRDSTIEKRETSRQSKQERGKRYSRRGEDSGLRYGHVYPQIEKEPDFNDTKRKKDKGYEEFYEQNPQFYGKREQYPFAENTKQNRNARITFTYTSPTAKDYNFVSPKKMESGNFAPSPKKPKHIINSQSNSQIRLKAICKVCGQLCPCQLKNYQCGTCGRKCQC